MVSVRFFLQVPPPPSEFVPIGDRRGPKILSSPHQKFREKTLKSDTVLFHAPLKLAVAVTSAHTVPDAVLKLICDGIWENPPHVAQGNFAEIIKNNLYVMF